jgi:hypothetical protein
MWGLRQQKQGFNLGNFASMTKCLAGMIVAMIKEKKNGTTLGEMFSSSRQFMNKYRHELIFKDVGINESLGLVIKYVSNPAPACFRTILRDQSHQN